MNDRSGKISREGRGALNASEKRVLAQQASNRANAWMSPAATEARQAAPAVDMSAKSPRQFRDSIGTQWRRPGG